MTFKSGFLRPKFLSTPNWVLDFLAFKVAFGLAFAVAYPIYQTLWLALNVAAGVFVAAGIVAFALWKKVPDWAVFTAGLVAYLLGGFILVGPFDSFRPAYLLGRFLEVLGAPVTGWRSILTLQIPLGTYHEVLAPAYLIALVTGLIAFFLVWGSERRWAWAASQPFVPLLFGILFGSSLATAIVPYIGGGLTHWALGAGVTLVLVLWLAWRPAAFASLSRTQALSTEGRAVRGRWLVSVVTRWALGTLMVVAAVGASWWVSPQLMGGRTRDVLRTNTDPNVQVALEVSPLATYRQYFSDDLVDTELFTFETEGEVARLRLSTLTDYDGNTYDAVEQPGGTYRRVPSRVPQPIHSVGDGSEAQPGGTTTTSISIDQYSGIWVPLADGLSNIDFQGDERRALADGFYYNAQSATGIEVAGGGLNAQARYVMDAHPDLADHSELLAFSPAGAQQLDVELPESLEDWVKAQEVGSDGASLLTLVDRLRARSYLSHGLLEDEDAKWRESLPNYTFAPSRSGHSLDRMDRIFTRLLEQQTNAGEDPSDELLVSAIGDDEQLAVAVALVAQHLGYEARVVVGFRTAPTASDDDLTYCQAGVCRGGDLTVWTEVQDGKTGQWGAIDVTPQYAMSPAPRIDRQSDPKYHTVVEPEGANIMPPPQAEPAGSDSHEDVQDEEEHTALTDSPIFRWVTVSVLGLFLVLSPLIALLGLKKIRTARRKSAPTASERIVGAWRQYEDSAIDAGYRPVPAGTRVETVRAWSQGSAAAMALARNADLVTFGSAPRAAYDSGLSWNAYEQAAQDLAAGRSAWWRLRWRASPRALWWRLRSGVNE